jgi:hypothetical protein
MKILLILSFLLFFTFSCSTILNGSLRELHVTSIPEDVKFYFDDIEYSTPAIVKAKLEYDKDYLITFRKKDYKEKTVRIFTKFTTAFYGNLCIGGVIPGAIDLLTGGGLKFEKDNLSVTLDKL